MIIEIVWERRPPNAATRKDRALKAAKAAKAAAQRYAPAPPMGCLEIIVQGWRLDLDDDVICHVARSPAERGARECGTGLQLEPDSAAGFGIAAAYLHGVDISSDLTDEQIDEIEQQTTREIARRNEA